MLSSQWPERVCAVGGLAADMRARAASSGRGRAGAPRHTHIHIDDTHTVYCSLRRAGSAARTKDEDTR